MLIIFLCFDISCAGHDRALKVSSVTDRGKNAAFFRYFSENITSTEAIIDQNLNGFYKDIKKLSSVKHVLYMIF